VVLGILVSSLFAAQSSVPEREVQRNVIISAHNPKARIRLPEPVQYVGADRWVLYDIADCEVHVFVEADERKNVQRLYWVQFESYVPSRPELAHTYDSPRHAQIGDWDFYVDTWVRAHAERTRPGSDREHIEALLRSKGYKMPAGTMDVRLVHLLDQQKRKELMIIYSEDLAATGFNAAELQEKGKAHAQWPNIEERLIERAKSKISLELSGNE
jgi:hypothetical protein